MNTAATIQDSDQQQSLFNVYPTKQQQQQQKTTSSTERVISACAGAVATMLFVNPFDLVKTRLQEVAKMPNLEGQYLGTMDGLTKIVRNEGTFALWKGLSPGLLMAIPSTSIYYVGYDYIRDHTRSRFQGTAMDTYAPLWIGGLARTVTAAVISPMELFRTRLQSAEGAGGFKDALTGVRLMVQNEGILSLWRGLVPTMLRDVPFSAIYWMMYEELKRDLHADHQKTHLQQFQFSFLAGATSGTVAAVVTTPFDVVKTRRQVSSNKERHLLRLIQNLAVTEGIPGFFRGKQREIKKGRGHYRVVYTNSYFINRGYS
ncbi:mitochondrial carrier domain-containing protein [Halteromyces radiatus]|uniref:mitochondrial carrier domain-containing protein n=1 Tax=Halteromyces radiatus TaxID=101107 RepID=UPI00221EABF9|nr:mitochondrial carrier domain-containing protein [Halteromyces radiatus]KAI8077700.1 mitochondrial carrier domain-containing protein [Halteromyces radiatus]